MKRSAPLLLATAAAAVVLATAGNYGLTWDEHVYLKVADHYFDWLKDPSLDSIDAHWHHNNVHPPLHKALTGLTGFLLHDHTGWLSSIAAYRASTAVFVFLLTWCLFVFVRQLWGFVAALLATICLFLMPRVFFHAHLAALDYSMSTMWFLVVYAYWRAVLGDGGQRWVYYTAVLLGLAVLTKLNGLFLYAPLGLLWLMAVGPQFATRLRARERPTAQEVGRALHLMLPLVLIPPVLFVVLWPWLWIDTLQRISDYFLFHLGHFSVPVYYLGKRYLSAPWHYPFVLTAITVPLAILLPALLGAFRVHRAKDRRTAAFVLFNALLPLLISAAPGAPRFDGVRLFLPAFPYICMLAALGLTQAAEWLGRPRYRRLFVAGYALLLVASGGWNLHRYHPFHSSYYNALVGGLEGAAASGFEPEYWGGAYVALLPWLNQHPEDIYWVALGVIDKRTYVKDGRLDPRVRFGRRHDSTHLILLNRPGLFGEDMWEYRIKERPVYSVELMNTHLVDVYRIKR